VHLVQGTRRLLATITAFTAAHSLTLAGATLGWVQVPGPPVEASIALSIVFVASEIVHRRQGRYSVTQHYPWIVAFTFGLLHGFGCRVLACDPFPSAAATALGATYTSIETLLAARALPDLLRRRRGDEAPRKRIQRQRQRETQRPRRR